MRQKNHLEMNQDLFANIPSEIIIEIISKLPVRTIISCKCFCKSWLALLESHEFVNSHLLKSATMFNIPGCKEWISASANGLLFLCGMNNLRDAIHICNPITRNYIQLDCKQFVEFFNDGVVTYGFGSSKITGQHKVVRIFQDYVTVSGESYLVPRSECVCNVYTIGTGLWRRISHVAHLVNNYYHAKFLNGNLHWLVSGFEGPQRWISCFDLETEVFSTYSYPLLKSANSVGLTIFEDCLCLSDNSLTDGYAIWLMKEYGVEKSWTKQFFVINVWPFWPRFLYGDNAVYPIKNFKDGDILLAWKHEFFFYSKNTTVQKVETFEPHGDINSILYTPSFLSLKSFEMEKVTSF